MKAAFFSLRCGSQMFVIEANQNISVFSLDGTFIRKFRFDVSVSKQGAYRSACNQNGMFVHYGWYNDSDRIPGKPFRSNVAAWVSPGDSTRGRFIATVKSSERFEWSLQPLGRETQVALGRDRVYVAEGDAYEIKVFALDGKPLPSIVKAVKSIAPTKQDVADELDANPTLTRRF